MHTPVGLDAVRAFRAGIYRALGRRRDALFELLDAASRGGRPIACPHLSLVAGHRRGHGSVYAALREGTVDGSALRAALAGQPLGHGQAAYAVDVSVVARCDAETSPGRAYYHHASRHSAGQPIVAGWAYSWVAQLGTERSSWTAPLDAVRLAPGERPEAVAVRQIQGLAPRLAGGPGAAVRLRRGLQPGPPDGGAGGGPGGRPGALPG